MPAAPKLLLLCTALALAGCDLLGESAEAVAARKDAEGRAVGSACRHAMRAIEDCYALNRKAPKAAVFAGWREMDEYMRENKLEGIEPTMAKAAAKPAEGADGGDEGTDAGHEAGAGHDEAGGKAPAKGSGHGG